LEKPSLRIEIQLKTTTEAHPTMPMKNMASSRYITPTANLNVHVTAVSIGKSIGTFIDK
jgi:hypothetical protein